MPNLTDQLAFVLFFTMFDKVLIKKTYTNPYFLLILFACIGFTITWSGAGNLQKNAEYFGSFVLSLIVPLIISIFFLVGCASKPSPVKNLIILTLIVFMVSALPLLPLLNNSISYPETDDGYRYNVTAHYMIDHKTLWGADGIISQYQGARNYVFNPGYRYFLALELLIFKKDTRGLQLFNLLLWVVVISFFVRQLHFLFRQGMEKYLTLFFIAGSAIYAPKNILMNLSEWFCVLLFILYFLSYINKKIFLAVICLGLVVFTRQNLLFASLLLFLFTIKKKNIKQTLSYIAIYVLLLSLPLVHNIYYADTWQWLPRFVGGLENMIIPDSTGNIIKDLFISFYRTCLHYLLGVDPIFHNARQNIFGIVFIPFGVLLIFVMYRKMKANVKWLFLAQVIFVVGPTLVVSWAYFPRFEFINLYCLFISSLVLLNYNQSFPAPNDNYLHKLQ